MAVVQEALSSSTNGTRSVGVSIRRGSPSVVRTRSPFSQSDPSGGPVCFVLRLCHIAHHE